MANHENWKRLAKHEIPAEDMDNGLGHIVPIPLYNLIFGSLIALTVVTVWAATQDFGHFNVPIALCIATVKAALVTLYFMHLNWENKIIWGIVIYPLFILALILGSNIGDVATKDTPIPEFAKNQTITKMPSRTSDHH